MINGTFYFEKIQIFFNILIPKTKSIPSLSFSNPLKLITLATARPLTKENLLTYIY
jgi:hypothetical protein